MKPYRTAPNACSASIRVSPGLRTFLLSTLVVLAIPAGLELAACSAAQQKVEWAVLKDATGAICPLVVQSVLTPAAEPLCVGLSEIESVVQELASSAGKGADAGVAGTALATPPSGDELYQAILAHRRAAAKPAGK